MNYVPLYHSFNSELNLPGVCININSSALFHLRLYSIGLCSSLHLQVQLHISAFCFCLKFTAISDYTFINPKHMNWK